MQGVVLGSLFGMLALWVREIDGGKCFDFAMVLVAYAVGRSLLAFVPKMQAVTALHPHGFAVGVD